jgi:fumarate hydratase subunit alpha
MREIDAKKIKETVTELCLKANFELRKDVLKALKAASKKETNIRAKNILKSIVENANLAKKKKLAICQDTGFVSVYIKAGKDAIVRGDLVEAVNKGVEDAYKKGCLRKSIVSDPLIRKNTGTNTPCLVNIEPVEGDKIDITISPKGFGSENKSMIKMLRPTASEKDIVDFALDVVKKAGPDACPPLILGIGIGGTFDHAAHLSKKALLRPIEIRNKKKHFRALEKELLKAVNSLGIGPMGLGGKTTALGVNIEDFPTHIAGLPVAVSVSCHATRSAERII